MKGDNRSEMPKGFRPIDRSVIQGRINDESPVKKELQSLLVKDDRLRSERQVDTNSEPEHRKVKKLSDIISGSIQAANDLRSITHYIKRAEQIWTTLLLKPNGDQKQLLRYDTVDSDIKSSKLHEALIQTVENYFTTKYPFEKYVSQIIKDVLFRTGSYVLVNISHSALDHLINGMEISGSESLQESQSKFDVIYKEHFNNSLTSAKNIGFIRKDKTTERSGMEALYGTPDSAGNEYNLVHPDLKWTFTDNPIVLKTGELRQKLRAERLSQRLGAETLQKVLGNIYEKKPGKVKPNANNVGIMNKKDFDEHLDVIYPNRRYRQKEHLSIRKSKFYTGTGKGIGITYHVPSEACIPVHVNGEIGDPFGYILLVDPDTGEFLKSTSDIKFYQSTNQANSKRDSQSDYGSVNEMASHIKRIAAGGDCTVDMEWMIEMASAHLEKEFIEGFFNGDLNKTVSVSLTEHNKKLFLSRSLRQQGVRCVFTPAEYVTYVATDFSHLGIGKSLVEESKLAITRLAILDTANILAQIENALSKTVLTINLERENFDPRHVASMARDVYFAGNPQLADVLGYNNVSIDTIVDRFKEQSLQVKINAGDNKHIIAPEIEARQAEHEPLKTIDETSRDALLNHIAGQFCLKRSWLDDTGEGNDFAIEALADQELLRNQTSAYSKTFSDFFSDFMRKHIKCNEPLLLDLVETIKESKTLYQKPDQGGTLKDIFKVTTEDDDAGDLEEQTEIEMVLLDFLNNLYVELPQPAVNDTLNKVIDKIESIEKLVDTWMDMSGGKMIEKRAADLNIDVDTLKAEIRGMYIYHACERFNIPMPFDAILNNGDGGGILSLVSDITNLDRNGMKFFERYLKESTKNQKAWDKLKDKASESEPEMTGGDDFSSSEPDTGSSLEPSDNEPFMDQVPETNEETPDATPSEEEELDKETNEKTTDDKGSDEISFE